MQSQFDSQKAYLLSKGIGTMFVAGAKLVFVEGDQTFDCGKTYASTDPSGAFYCPANQTFLMTQSGLEYLESDAFIYRTEGEPPREELVVAHELGGHAVQYATGIGPQTAKEYTDNSVFYELRADCEAGHLLAGFDPATASILLNTDNQYFPGDDDPGQLPNTHGTRQQRLEAVRTGINGGPC
jgi:predicted metalloprotease